MKKNKIIISFLLMLFLFIYNFNITVFAANYEIAVDSEAAILIDTSSEKILYEKNSDKKMYPASTTKILTAIIALENCELTDVTTASYDAIMSLPSGYSNAAIQVGEQLTIQQLLEVFLIHSANEAGIILAEHIGGSIESFATIMNSKAEEIGCKSSNFTNPSGIHDENHYTTAKDMALIANYCMKNANFRGLVSKTNCTIEPTNKYEKRFFQTTNDLLLNKTKYYYEYAIGIKTGYTSQAKNCLISASNKNSFELICVVLGAGQTSNNLSARYIDSKNLFEYGYNNYNINKIALKGDVAKTIIIPNGTKETKSLDLILSDDISVLLNNSDKKSNYAPNIVLNQNLSAPIAENSIIGKLTYTIDNIEYTTNLLASHNVEKSDSTILLSAIFLIIIILFILYKLLFKSNHKKRKNKKRKYKNYL